jgi:aryl-alcohol dehydrogenase-like predicted oxidoreductase
MEKMEMRNLGSTGIKVSAVGFGAWQLGNDKDFLGMPLDEGIKLVHTALAKGCNLFDTAPNYGLGKSETYLGHALKGRRSEAVIVSKFGHGSNGKTDFDVAKMRSSVEESLGRLQTDHVDALVLHNPPIEVLASNSPQFEMMRALKKEGKIRSFGASSDWGKEVDAVCGVQGAQVIELLFNIFHQEPVATFERAQKAGIGIIVKVPLDSGWLAGKYTKETEFLGVRKRWKPEIIERRVDLVKRIGFITEDGSTMTQAALRFCMAFPAISSVMPGARSLAQLNENLSAAEKKMPQPIVEKLREFWKSKLKDNPLPW